ncbi:MAG: cardiolipin synthase [Planctomycetota bacterium]
MIFELNHWTTWSTLYLLGEWLIRLGMLLWIPNRRSPEAAKGWLLLIFFLPSLGILLYWLIGRPTMPASRRRRNEQLLRLLAPVGERLRASPNLTHPDVGPDLNTAVQLAANTGRLPILGGNTLQLLPDYVASIERLAADIDAASHHVHLLYYIFAADEVTQPVIEALQRAAQRGVQCRVLVDALGSKRMLPGLRSALAHSGVHLIEMLKTGIWRQFARRGDLRNHRKIAVIDGQVAYTGSQNLISPTFKAGITYEELVVRATGPIALEFQFVFVSDWHLETNEVLDAPEFFPEPQATGSQPAQVLPSGPTYSSQSTQRLVVLLIHNARQRVVVTTPYFIPDESLQHALQTAAMRGVEVHLVVSEVEDQFLVGQAQQSYYEELLETGVRIHLFQGEFLHAKHLSIDEEVCLIGSSNMDIRSFVLNAEISLLAYDRQLTEDLINQQKRYFSRSRELQLSAWRRRSYLRQLSQNVCRLLSPLL